MALLYSGLDGTLSFKNCLNVCSVKWFKKVIDIKKKTKEYLIFLVEILEESKEIIVRIGIKTKIMYLEIKTGLKTYPNINGKRYARIIVINKTVKIWIFLINFFSFIIKINKLKRKIPPIKRDPKKLEKKKFV